MTNKEAIKILEELPDRIVSVLMPLDIDFDYKEALDLAIKALEQQLKCGCNTCEYYPMKDQRPLLDLIDNAPTVAKDYDTGYQDGLEDGLNDIRPQGEWIKEDLVTGRYRHQCNVCGFYQPIFGNYTTNFCPDCGADMRGGKK